MPYARLENSLVSLKHSCLWLLVWVCGSSSILEAGKPTLRLEHVLRVVDSLGGEFTLNGFASSHSATAPVTANAHDARAARLQALDELTAQAQELKMGYE